MSDNEQGIVSAVGTASSVKGGDGKQNVRLSAAVEAAMSQAVLDATAEGISLENSEEIRARMMAARQRVLDEARGVKPE